MRHTVPPVADLRSLSLEQARRIAVGAQGLTVERPKGRIDRRHLRRVMSTLHLIQLDSVPVIARTQYLPFFSRLGAYRPELFDDMAWGRSAEWFETWSHEASVVPHELEPLLRWSRRRAAKGETWRHLAELASREEAYVSEVLAEVTERGPLLASELSDPRPIPASDWGSRLLGGVALDWLFRIGEVGIRRTANFEKRFDVLGRIVPPEVLGSATPEEGDAHRQLLDLSGACCGIGRPGDLADHFRLKLARCREPLSELIEEGRLEQVRVDGIDGTFLLHAEATMVRRGCEGRLLSPFDPMVWRRPRLDALFGFDYKLEIYTPAAKRRWGYYVLPFLLGSSFAARLDLKLDRSRGWLLVRAAHLEPGAVLDEATGPLAAEVGELARFLRARHIEVERAGPLDRALGAELSDWTAA